MRRRHSRYLLQNTSMENNLLTSIMAILGSDPLKQVNRLQMYESKFHELTSVYKILDKRNIAIETVLRRFWPEIKLKSSSDIKLLERNIGVFHI